MGYADQGGRRAVEVFMQDYFRHATRVGELTRVFLTELEARHAKREASLFGRFKLTKRVKAGFKLVQGRIDLKRPERVPEGQAEPVCASSKKGCAPAICCTPT
jgi:[protein-PII] uridylyltransferase